jgi:hypothetical protein
MSNHLIGPDILLMRKRYNEALSMQGVPAKYQFPNIAQTNEQGESEIDSYSEPMDTFIFFDGNPKVKTFKRYGWVVDNDTNLPFLLHCSWDLPKVQKDSIFSLSGLYSELTERKFRVTEITYDMVAADHLICQVVPIANGQPITGRTRKETEQTFNKSSHFLKDATDYRGNDYKGTYHPGDK